MLLEEISEVFIIKTAHYIVLVIFILPNPAYLRVEIKEKKTQTH